MGKLFVTCSGRLRPSGMKMAVSFQSTAISRPCSRHPSSTVVTCIFDKSDEIWHFLIVKWNPVNSEYSCRILLYAFVKFWGGFRSGSFSKVVTILSTNSVIFGAVILDKASSIEPP